MASLFCTCQTWVKLMCGISSFPVPRNNFNSVEVEGGGLGLDRLWMDSHLGRRAMTR